MTEYVYIIYSCFKNRDKSELLYALLDKVVNEKTTNKLYILNGVPNLKHDHSIINDKHLLVKCGDNYEDLCEKTIQLMKTISAAFPNIRGLFKIDDDIIPNITHLREFIDTIERNDIDYSGRMIEVSQHYSRCHYGKCSNTKHKIPKLCHGCKYATGPLYYLSKKSIDVLSSVLNYDSYFFEDIMVSHILQQKGITVYNYVTYYDNMNYFEKTIQNTKNYNFIFARLYGGLGNQLFVVSSAYNIARQNNMILILYNDKTKMTHYTDVEYTKTIFKHFNSAPIEIINKMRLVTFAEKRCFDYEPNIITHTANYLLHGYFQNRKYSPSLPELTQLFNNDEICDRLLSIYPMLYNSYFIHIRMGDYVNNSIYKFDKDAYYSKATSYILDKDKNAHFFVLSDDEEFTKKYTLLEGINKTIVENMNPLDTFYLMTMCKRGGICANSTFSGWASKLNTNKDKIVVLPKQWININYEFEIPFNFTVSL